MSLELFNYRRIDDLERALAALPPCEGRIFVGTDPDDRKFLDALLSGRGYSFKVFRWQDLYSMFAEMSGGGKARVQLDPPDHWLLLRGIVSARLASGKPMPEGASRRGFLKILGSQIRELIREEVSPAALEPLFAPDDPIGSAMIGLYRDYLSVLDENGLSDSAGVTTETRKLLELPSQNSACGNLDIVFSGFSAFTHSQLGLVRALNGAGARVRIFAPESGLGREYGVRQQFGLEGADISDKRPFGVVRLCGADPRGEFETAARSLALWEQGEGELAALGGFPGWEDIAMTVPSSRIGAARQAFSRYGLPCTWASRVRISDTPLFSLSSACLDAASGGWQTEAVIRLLTLPWLCGSSFDVRSARKARVRTLPGWEKFLKGDDAVCFRSCVDYADAVLRVGGTGKDLLSALGKFAKGREMRASALIKDMPGLDCEINLFARALAELERRVLYIREVVRDLGDIGRQEMTGGDARAFLDTWAQGTTIPPQGGLSGCMKAFEDTPPALFHVPYWFVFGTDAGSWPGKLKEAPLIDEAHKIALHEDAALSLGKCHLPLLAEQRVMREVLFRRMIACGDRCTFLCRSANDDEGRPIDETTLVQVAAEDGWISISDTSVGHAGLLIPPEKVSLARVEAHRAAFGFGLPAERRFPEGVAFRVSAPKSVKLSSVDDFADCPYKFALANLLKYERSFDTGEYDSAKGGNVMHALWKKVWTEKAKPESINKPVKMLANQFFDEAVDGCYPELSKPNLRRMYAQLRFRVLRAAELQDRIYDITGKKTIKIEHEYKLPTLEIDGIEYSGRADRIDWLDDENFILWDYKSGVTKTYKDAYQLKCYALALEEAEKDKKAEKGENAPTPENDEKNRNSEKLPKCVGYAYICMGDGKIRGKFDTTQIPLDKTFGTIGKFGEKEHTEVIQDAKQLLENMAKAVKESTYPPEYDKRHCDKCDYQAICRRGEMRGRFDAGDEGENDE